MLQLLQSVNSGAWDSSSELWIQEVPTLGLLISPDLNFIYIKIRESDGFDHV